MKKNWEIKKLGELTLDKMSYGTSSPSCEYDGETRYIRITDINDNGSLNEDFVSPISYEEKHILQDGDIVFARTGATVGKAYCYHSSDAKYVYAGYLIRLRPNKKIVLPDYIFYYTKSKNYLDFIRSSQVAAAQPNVNAEKYSNLEIPIPPLEEQKRIVKILDEKFAQLESLKANAQTNLQNAKDLFQSQLTKAFSNTTWEKKRLGEVCDVRDGTHDSPKFYDKGYPLVTSKNLKNGKIEMINLKYISKEDYEKINERSKVDINDILFAMIGTIGNPVLVTEEPTYAIKNMALIKDIGNIFPNYLLFYLSSNCALDKMLHDSNGTTQRFVSLGYLRNFEIPLPPLPEQKRIVKELDTLSEKTKALCAIYEKQIADCAELKQSLLQKAFEGEL